MTVPGVGPLIATALIASVGSARQFKSGRELSAWFGLCRASIQVESARSCSGLASVAIVICVPC
jgi:transposase